MYLVPYCTFINDHVLYSLLHYNCVYFKIMRLILNITDEDERGPEAWFVEQVGLKNFSLPTKTCIFLADKECNSFFGRLPSGIKHYLRV